VSKHTINIRVYRKYWEIKSSRQKQIATQVVIH